jgi:hypothetical protein
MTNQQLLDYISQQLAVGTTRESIRTALTSQGWSDQDITEGFVVIGKSTVTPVPQTPLPPSVEPVTPIQPVIAQNEKASTPGASALNTIWTKRIPKINIGFMIPSLLLVFGLDLIIILSSSDLKSFWDMMLIVIAIFIVLLCLENFVFSKMFAGSTSSLDKGILTLITIRNILFLLNFIPFIQLLGLLVIISVGWVIGLIYLGLIIARFIQAKKVNPQPQAN